MWKTYRSKKRIKATQFIYFNGEIDHPKTVMLALDLGLERSGVNWYKRKVTDTEYSRIVNSVPVCDGDYVTDGESEGNLGVISSKQFEFEEDT